MIDKILLRPKKFKKKIVWLPKFLISNEKKFKGNFKLGDFFFLKMIKRVVYTKILLSIKSQFMNAVSI